MGSLYSKLSTRLTSRPLQTDTYHSTSSASHEDLVGRHVQTKSSIAYHELQLHALPATYVAPAGDSRPQSRTHMPSKASVTPIRRAREDRHAVRDMALCRSRSFAGSVIEVVRSTTMLLVLELPHRVIGKPGVNVRKYSQ
jgi:hypothetical protein